MLKYINLSTKNKEFLIFHTSYRVVKNESFIYDDERHQGMKAHYKISGAIALAAAAYCGIAYLDSRKPEPSEDAVKLVNCMLLKQDRKTFDDESKKYEIFHAPVAFPESERFDGREFFAQLTLDDRVPFAEGSRNFGNEDLLTIILYENFHGKDDKCRPISYSRKIAELSDGCANGFGEMDIIHITSRDPTVEVEQSTYSKGNDPEEGKRIYGRIVKAILTGLKKDCKTSVKHASQ